MSYNPASVLALWSDMIGMRTRAPKSSEGKMANGRETLRLRSKGAATVQEVVSPTGEKATRVDPSSPFVYEPGPVEDKQNPY